MVVFKSYVTRTSLYHFEITCDFKYCYLILTLKALIEIILKLHCRLIPSRKKTHLFVHNAEHKFAIPN